MTIALEGQTAIVIGASCGKGKAIAAALGAAGARVALASRREEGIGRAAEELRNDGSMRSGLPAMLVMAGMCRA